MIQMYLILIQQYMGGRIFIRSPDKLKTMYQATGGARNPRV